MGMILHDWNLEKKLQLIRAAYEALRPGGALVSIEHLIDDARRENAFGPMMSLNMLIEFGDSFDFTGADFAGWCVGPGGSGKWGKTTPRVFGGKSPLRQQRRAQPARGTMSKVPSRPTVLQGVNRRLQRGAGGVARGRCRWFVVHEHRAADQEWETEYCAFQQRSLADCDYVYVWVDGVHFNVRLEDDCLCTLVMIGVRPTGRRS